ncbi:MAG: hypothetical protein ACK517_00295, partial [bacterium]
QLALGNAFFDGAFASLGCADRGPVTAFMTAADDAAAAGRLEAGDAELVLEAIGNPLLRGKGLRGHAGLSRLIASGGRKPLEE